MPKVLRYEVFKQLHNIRHGGIKASRNMIGQRYLWPFMKSDIKNWVEHCVICQKSKITRHNRAEMSSVEKKSQKFECVHEDLVGPLPECDNMKYILTMVDSFSGWTEMIPLPNKNSETVAKNFYLHWIARYGIPRTVKSDRGTEFTGVAFSQMLLNLGC